MAGASIADVALGAGERIGRYFNIVSVLPSTFLVFYGYALVASGAWAGPPDWAGAFDQLTTVSLGLLSILAVLVLAVAAALHPLQVAITQLFEGYWGVGRLGLPAAVALVHRHRAIYERLFDARESAGYSLSGIGQTSPANLTRPQDVPAVLRRAEADRLLRGYPGHPSRIMPTRLGNALRRWEDLAGRQYELPTVTVVPYLALVAPQEHVAYLDDQRAQLDSAIRMSLVGLLATAMSVGFLWSDGAWLLVALVPYALAYLSYRGAVTVAGEYGTALATLVALDRFALYDSLNLDRPASTADERARNRDVGTLLAGGDRAVDLSYRTDQPEPTPPWWYVRAASAAAGVRARLGQWVRR